MKNPWKTIASSDKYDNPWISVREDKVITPSGNDGIYGVVHFKNLAIGIIPIDDQLNTWLVGQHRYALNEYSWEIPMGGGPHGIDALESAKKELLEETGISARSWTNLFRIHTSNSATDEEGYIFLAKELSFGEAQPEDTEDLALQKIPLSEARNMVLTGKITDAISIAGILRVAHELL